MSTEQIKINWNDLGNERVLNPDELIFRKQHQDLCRAMRRAAEENVRKSAAVASCCMDCMETAETSYELSRCFFIDGSRGCGKTTLMRAVRAALLERGEGTARIASLADVDPTELGKEENFFLYLMGRIYHLLDGVYRRCRKREQEVEQLRAAMESLRKLSGGLCVLMNSQRLFNGHDSDEFSLEEAAEKCADSALLRQKLNDLLNRVCGIVGADVLLVTIDDADLDFSKCEEVLEYVRKFLRSPRLLFLFAGDLKLYSHVVRGMYVRSFAEALWQHDASHEASRQHLLDRLEDQYLIKLFPSVNRVSVGGFAAVLEPERRAEVVLLSPNGESRSVTLRTMLNYYFDLVTSDERGRSVLYKLFRQLPLRSAFFLLQYWHREMMNGKEVQGAVARISRVRIMARGLEKIAVQTLVKYGIDYTALAQGDWTTVLHQAFVHMARLQGGRNKEFSLLPTADDAERALAVLYLSVVTQLASTDVEAPYVYLCTMFPLWQQLNRRLGQSDTGEHGSNNAERVAQEIWDAGVEDRSIAQWGAQACACMAPRESGGEGQPRRFFGGGTIRLIHAKQEWSMADGYLRRHSAAAMMQELAKPENYRKGTDALFCLAVYHSLCRVEGDKGSFYYLSVYNSVCFAAELLSIGVAYKGNSEGVRRMVRQILCGGYRVPSVSVGDVGAHVAQEDRHPANAFIPEVEVKEVEDALCGWVEQYAKDDAFCIAPAAYQHSWDAFIAQGDNVIREVVLKGEKNDNFPHALSLLQRYMGAFIDALSGLGDIHFMDWHRLADCLMKFPLWEAVMAAETRTPELYQLLNQVNIGTLVDMRLIRAYQEIRSKWEQADAVHRECMENEERAAGEVKAREKLAREAAKNEKKARATEMALVATCTKGEQSIEMLQKQVGENKAAIQDIHRELAQLKMAEKKSSRSEQRYIQLLAEKQEEEKSILAEIRNLERQEKVLQNHVQKMSTKTVLSGVRPNSQEMQGAMVTMVGSQGVKSALVKERNKLARLRSKKRALSAELTMLKKDIKETVAAQKTLTKLEQQKERDVDKTVAKISAQRVEHQQALLLREEAHREFLLAEDAVTSAEKMLQEARTSWNSMSRELASVKKELAAAERQWKKAQLNDEELILSILS